MNRIMPYFFLVLIVFIPVISFASTEKKLDRAVIVAAGKGTRMRPYTFAICKELILIADKPIIHHIVDELLEVGIKKILIVISPKKSNIINYFNNIKSLSDKISYIIQPFPNGAGNALLISKPWVEGKDFIFALGDTLISTQKEVISSEPLKDLVALYQKQKADFYVIAKMQSKFSNKGIMSLGVNLKTISNKVTKMPYAKASARWILSSKNFNLIDQYKGLEKKEVDFVEVIKNSLNNNVLHGIVKTVDKNANDLGTWTDFLNFNRIYWMQIKG